MRKNARSSLAIVVGVLALALMGVDDGCGPKSDPPQTDCVNGLSPSDPDCRLECRRNGDCPANEFCDFEVCVNTCLDDDPNCVNTCIGFCLPRECVCPDVYDPVCGVDGQTYGNACEARCARVEIAYEGECDEPSACRGDGDCPAGEVCELGGQGCDTPVCVTGCHEDAQCAPDQVCQEVQCVTCPCPGQCMDGVQPECRNDDDCPAGEVCELGGRGCDTPVCVSGCHEDAQCKRGQACLAVQCFTCPCPGQCDDVMQPDCRNDDDCAAGEVCELGGQGCDTPVCVSGCHEDAQCAPDQVCQEVQCFTCPCPGLCF